MRPDMGELTDTVNRLVALGPRAPGSDGERRAAVALRQTLGRRGREAELETVWVRPSWPLTHALHCAMGVAGSVLAAVVPVAGLAVLAAAGLSVVLDLAGHGWLARMLTPLRATQNVLSPPPLGPARPFRLIVCAHYDAGRPGGIYGERVTALAARAQRTAGGRLPGAAGWLVIALLILIACALARVLGGSERALGVVQLIPTAGLIVAIVALLDVALSPASPGAGDNASGVAVAIEVVRALDQTPPRALDVELLLTGAGDAPGAGLRAHLRKRRPRPDQERTVVLGLWACGAGTPAWLSHEGTLLALPTHRQLRAACERATEAESALHVPALRSHRLSPLAPARDARLPTVTIGCRDELGRIPRSHRADDDPEHVEARPMEDALAYALAFVDALDADLDARS
jgi:hypothetical protein